MDTLGLDALCERIADGESLSALSRSLGVGIARLCEWIDANSERSARVLAARKQSAEAYSDRALEVIEAAADPFALAKARELAHHYRWMSKVRDPRTYADKLGVGAAEGLPPVAVQAQLYLPVKDAQPAAMSRDRETAAEARRRPPEPLAAPTPAPTPAAAPAGPPEPAEPAPRAAGFVRPSGRFFGADPRFT